MPVAAHRTLTVALATSRDIARRPGAWLALVGTAILLAVLPGIARRALDAGPGLGVELTLSTIWLHAGLLATLAGVRASSADAPLGPSPELLVTPLSPSEYALGRALGVTAAALAHAALLLLIGAACFLLAGEVDIEIAGLGGALAAGSTQTLLLATVGIATGALLGDTMGVVSALAILVAGRLAGPTTASSLSGAAWWIVDLARLDLSRAAAFARPVGAPAVAAAVLGAALQAAGCLVLASIALARRAAGDRG